MNLTCDIPLELSFEPVNLCNAKCFCCPYTLLSEDKAYTQQKMSSEQIEKLITEFGELTKEKGVKPLTASVQPWRYSDPLVCKDLELVCQLAEKYDLIVQLTTNAVSFTDAKCEMLSRYLKHIPQIFVSVIGYNQKEIKDWMDIDLNITRTRLLKMKERYPELSKKLVIGIKHKNQSPNKADYAPVIEEFRKLTLGKVKVKKRWLENRLVSNKLSTDGINFEINENNFINGCRMNHGKILRRLEIMVGGQAVLCCDDATGQTNYGNVFDIGIQGVWENLSEAHSLIYNQEYTNDKKDLICNSCSRGCVDWTPADTESIRAHNRIING